jgi:hypothetical protein
LKVTFAKLFIWSLGALIQLAPLAFISQQLERLYTFVKSFESSFLTTVHSCHYRYYDILNNMPVYFAHQEMIDVAVGVGIFSSALVMVGGLFSMSSESKDYETTSVLDEATAAPALETLTPEPMSRRRRGKKQ